MLAAVNLGEILWSLLVIYLMIMYFVLVATIVVDIFRSDDLSGVSKALWALALLVVPVGTMVLYLIVRGSGMDRRRVARAADSFRPDNRQFGPASELEKAKSLMDSGVLTASEYAQLKTRILA